ncbi:MAG TPA: hypothetical protein PK887_01595 [Ignavibacteriales bacterium]|nr:hypothetical protein [Ignavibacteriales bacterium]
MKKILLYIFTTIILFAQAEYNPKYILKKQILETKKHPTIVSDTLIKSPTKDTTALIKPIKNKQNVLEIIILYKLYFIYAGIIIILLITFLIVIMYLKNSKSKRKIKKIEYIRDGRIIPEYNKQLIKFRKKLPDSDFVKTDKKEILQQNAKEIGVTVGELELASKIKKLKDKKNNPKKKK